MNTDMCVFHCSRLLVWRHQHLYYKKAWKVRIMRTATRKCGNWFSIRVPNPREKETHFLQITVGTFLFLINQRNKMHHLRYSVGLFLLQSLISLISRLYVNIKKLVLYFSLKWTYALLMLIKGKKPVEKPLKWDIFSVLSSSVSCTIFVQYWGIYDFFLLTFTLIQKIKLYHKMKVSVFLIQSDKYLNSKFPLCAKKGWNLTSELLVWETWSKICFSLS